MNDLSRPGQRGRVGGLRRIQIHTVRSAVNVYLLLRCLRQRGGLVVDGEGVPGVGGAGGEHDVGALDAHAAVHLVGPSGLRVRGPAVECRGADLSAEVKIQPSPAVKGLAL